ncbi:hypothetical protein ACFV98_02345 [Streptomyces violascens]|uniref:hypothetical protein n=1 Tax=Streptomyces violascens TaxID=67381 RepID=UPI003667B999
MRGVDAVAAQRGATRRSRSYSRSGMVAARSALRSHSPSADARGWAPPILVCARTDSVRGAEATESPISSRSIRPAAAAAEPTRTAARSAKYSAR